MTSPRPQATDELNVTLLEVPIMDRTGQILSDYVQPSICMFGILCNVLNLLVLTRPQLKESPYTYLLGLAVTDLSVLLMVFIRSVVSQHLGAGVYGWQFYNGFIFLPIANMFANSSVWITVLLTVERWISVKFPLKAKDVCTKRLARRTMLVIVLVAAVINIPRFFCQKIIATSSAPPSGGGIYYTLVSSDFEQSDAYRAITWLYIVLIHVVPYVTLVILNTCLLYVVYSANKTRAGLNETPHCQHHNIAVHISREQRRLTVTCASIIWLFLVCVIPTAFSNRPVAYALFGGHQPQQQFFQQSEYRLLMHVTNTLLTCNLSLNFVLYCLFNHKFLKTLRHLANTYVYRMCKIELAAETTFRRMSGSSSGKATAVTGGPRHCPCERCRRASLVPAAAVLLLPNNSAASLASRRSQRRSGVCAHMSASFSRDFV